MGLTMKTTTNLRLVTPPVAAPVSLAEARAWLRVDHDAEDELIASLITAATAALDGRTGFLGRCLEPQTWELSLDRFPEAEIQLALGPVASVEAITFTDPDGVEGTVSADAYTLDNTPTFVGWAVPSAPWPATMETVNAVRVRFVAGTGTPEPVKQALLDMIAAKYDERGGGKMLSPGIVGDLSAFRRPVVLA
jgi:uncharacterized phiE125 gp8 family phage protein